MPRLNVLGYTTRAPYRLFSIPKLLDALDDTEPLVKRYISIDTVPVAYGTSTPSGALTIKMAAKGLPSSLAGSLNCIVSSSTTNESVTGSFLFLQCQHSSLIEPTIMDWIMLFSPTISVTHHTDQGTYVFSMQAIVYRSIMEVFLDGGAYRGTVTYFAQGWFESLALGSTGLGAGAAVELEV